MGGAGAVLQGSDGIPAKQKSQAHFSYWYRCSLREFEYLKKGELFVKEN